MFSIFKKSEEKVDVSTSGYEETEQKTPYAGYILLFIMFIAAVFFGWRAINDLRDVPSRPESLSYCSAEFLPYSWEDLGRFSYLNQPIYEPEYRTKPPYPAGEYYEEQPPCNFSSFEVKYGIPATHDKRKTVNRNLQDIEIKLSRLSQDIRESEDAYNNLPAGRFAIVGGKSYSLIELQEKIADLRRERVAEETERDRLKGELKVAENELRTKYKKLMSEYRVLWRWYEFKLFLLEAIFVFPFFWFVFRGYKKLLAKNSPYAIIFTALLAVASVLTLRILIVWFWSLFLARLIQTLWNFIQNFALLKSLVFYGGMFLSIAIFGGAVYWLQKRIFDPKRVALRRLRQKQCPSCQTSLDLAQDFCPNCGRKLREKCSVCGNKRWLNLSTCGYCGNKI